MINIYDTRTMIKAVEQMKRPRTFLLDTFFRNVIQYDTAVIDIDTYKGKRRLAPFVHPDFKGKVSDRVGFSTNTFKPPYIKVKRALKAADLQIRLPGESLYSATSADDRLAALLGKDLADLDNQITRREEWMASSAIQTGVVVVKGDGVDTSVDFQMSATHLVTLAGNDLWSDTVNSDPVQDFRTWRRLISQDSGLTPNVGVFGSDAWDNFVIHPKVKDMLDTRRIDMGIIDPMLLPNGVTYMGYLKEVGLDLYTYDEWYIDEDTLTEKPMVDSKKVILGSTNAQTSRSYGMIQDTKARGQFAVPRYPKVWDEDDEGVSWLMMQSAALVCPHEVDGFLCAQVLA